MNVNLTYFKPSGKYYAEGSFQSIDRPLHQIWDEVIERNRLGYLPGLIGGSSQWIILVDVPDHPHRHPRLIMPEVEDTPEPEEVLVKEPEVDLGLLFPDGIIRNSLQLAEELRAASTEFPTDITIQVKGTIDHLSTNL